MVRHKITIQAAYGCEICGTFYSKRSLAEICEGWGFRGTRFPDLEYGQEVKLKNRNGGYTKAFVRDIVIKASPFANQEFLQDNISGSSPHEYQLVLDRIVLLDKTWESARQTVPLFYVLDKATAAKMEEKVNSHG